MLYLLYLLCLYLAHGSNRPLSGQETHCIHSNGHPFAIYLTLNSHCMCKAIYIPSMICDMMHNNIFMLYIQPLTYVIQAQKLMSTHTAMREPSWGNEAGVNFAFNMVTSLVSTLDEEYDCRIII